MRYQKVILSIALIALFPFSILFASDAELKNPIAVIVHKNNNSNEIGRNELARIYRGQKDRWSTGQKILAINLTAGAGLRHRFYRIVLDAGPAETFLIPGTPVLFRTIELQSNDSVISYVARFPNAIGYIEAGAWDKSKPIKLLKINGKLPGEEGYELE
ncbi:MAG: substrate-binding domain-containing protein [Candidatus Omnitrophica bacterium]|nr:substrate-binding domain-containing protein [Candidatus Omnitrophota bacterium]